VHLVCALSPTVTIEKLIEHVKSKTAAWAKKTPNSVATLAWQSSYGVFSVSQSNLERVMDYVMRQEEHHKRKSFQDEFRELCQKHGIAIDEQRVWE
jgi:putative transposase